jgi:DNA-binding transcriptional ArsR family regulator
MRMRADTRGGADPAGPELSDAAAAVAVESFRMLADETRLQLLLALADAERSVAELSRIVDRPPSAVSQHLAKLRLTRLVATRRDGNRIFYRLENMHVRQLLEDALSHIDHLQRGLPDHGRTHASSTDHLRRRR